MKKYITFLIVFSMLFTFVSCKDNDTEDDFNASSYIVSVNSEMNGSELATTAVVKDEWEYTSAIKRNKIRNEINEQISEQESEYKKKEDVNSQSITVTTENSEDVDMSPEEVSTLLYSGNTERGIDECIVRIDGKLYYGTTEKAELKSTEQAIGTITSYTKDESVPAEDDQANIDITGSEYADGGRYIRINITDNWYYFYSGKRMFKVFYDEELSDPSLSVENPIDNMTDLLGETALSLYNSDHYGTDENGEKIFIEAIEVNDYYEVGNKLQVFIDVSGEGYTIHDDYINSTHGFGERMYLIFEKDDEDNYTFVSAMEHGKAQGAEESDHDFCVSPLDGKFLKATYKKLFEEEQPEKIHDVLDHMLKSYTKSIGKDGLEVKI